MSLIEGEDEMDVSEDESLDYDGCSDLGVTYAELTPLEPLAEFESDALYRISCDSSDGGYHDCNSLEYIPPLTPVPPDCDDVNSSDHHSSILILSLLDCKNNFALVDVDSKRLNGSGLKQVDNQCLQSTETCPSPSHSDKVVDWSDLELDTRDVAERVTNELKRLNISQVLFAQKILGRSQGTLSDLLRNPKPWAKMKSGRETFGRMLKWLQESDSERLSILSSPKSCKSSQTVSTTTAKK